MYVTCRLLDRHLQAQRSRRRRLWLKPPRPQGRRPCKRNRKRARDAAARMAEPPPPPPDATKSSSLFVWTRDCGGHELCLIYGVRFDPIPPGSVPPRPPSVSDDHFHNPLAVAVSDGSEALEFRPSMDPVICWNEEEQKYSAHAAVSGDGTIVALVAGSTRTVIHDGATGADTPGPQVRRSKPRPIMLPVGDHDTVLVMNEVVRRGRHCFEALRRVPGGGGGWRADALPDPPVAYEYDDNDYSMFMDDEDFEEPGLHIMAYFAQGSRAWISLHEVGTFSVDMEEQGGAWRMEGKWELPLRQRGFFLPELGGLVVGFPESARGRSMDKERCYQVCALDVEARPPAVRRVWEIPPERVEEVPDWEMVSLAYLGNGRFCIARSIQVEVLDDGQPLCGVAGTSLALLDMRRLPGGELELAKYGKVHAHTWPVGHVGHASFI